MADIHGEQAPVDLPSRGSDGKLAGDVPWRALELLAGNVLSRVGSPPLARLVDLLGWIARREGPRDSPRRLSLEGLATEPVRTAGDWVQATALGELAAWLSTLVTGDAAPGVGIGALSGRGDAASPLVLWLKSG